MDVHARMHTKMQQATEPDLADRGNVEGRAEASLGTTAANKEFRLVNECGDEQLATNTTDYTKTATWQKKYHALPVEIHANIMAHLHRDPVSQLCLSLVSRYWHGIFHDVVDLLTPSFDGKSTVNRRYRPLASDLRCQVTKDEQGMIYGQWHSDHLIGVGGVQWNLSLLDVLWGEVGLWRGTWWCQGCGKVKIDEAFEAFGWEEEMLRKHERQVETPQEYPTGNCRRCRVKHVLLHLEGLKEYFDCPSDRISADYDASIASVGVVDNDFLLNLSQDDEDEGEMIRFEWLRDTDIELTPLQRWERAAGRISWEDIWENLGV